MTKIDQIKKQLEAAWDAIQLGYPTAAKYYIDTIISSLGSGEVCIHSPEQKIQSDPVCINQPQGHSSGELLPCPFCNEAAQLVKETEMFYAEGIESGCVHIGCNKCDIGFGWGQPDEIAKQWNTRAPMTVDADVVARAKKAIAEHRGMEDYGMKNGYDPESFDDDVRIILTAAGLKVE